MPCGACQTVTAAMPGLGVAFQWHFMLVQCLMVLLGPAALQADAGIEPWLLVFCVDDSQTLTLCTDGHVFST